MADATLDERTEYFDFVYRVKLYVKLAKNFYRHINDNPKLDENVKLPRIYEDTLAKIMRDLMEELPKFLENTKYQTVPHYNEFMKCNHPHTVKVDYFFDIEDSPNHENLVSNFCEKYRQSDYVKGILLEKSSKFRSKRKTSRRKTSSRKSARKTSKGRKSVRKTSRRKSAHKTSRRKSSRKTSSLKVRKN